MILSPRINYIVIRHRGRYKASPASISLIWILPH